MFHKFKGEIPLSKNKQTVKDFLKVQTAKTFTKASIVGEKTYQFMDEYDRFVLTRLLKPFEKTGFLEMNAILRISAKDDENSILQYTIRYSDLSILFMVFLYGILFVVLFFVHQINFSGHIILLSSLLAKAAFVLFYVACVYGGIWLGLYFYKDKYIELVHEIVSDLQ